MQFNVRVAERRVPGPQCDRDCDYHFCLSILDGTDGCPDSLPSGDGGAGRPAAFAASDSLSHALYLSRHDLGMFFMASWLSLSGIVGTVVVAGAQLGCGMRDVGCWWVRESDDAEDPLAGRGCGKTTIK